MRPHDIEPITPISGKNKGIDYVAQTFRSAWFGRSEDLHYSNKETFPETGESWKSYL